MIYTVTLNPSIDHYIFCASDILPERTNRAERTANLCGGKGINVSIVCAALGLETVCTGFQGGFTGKELLRQLDLHGITHDFVTTANETRINTKIINNGKVTEINAKGPDIKKEEKEKLLDLLSGIRAKDTVVLSGSVPDTPGLLEDVIKTVKSTGARFIADTSGDALTECVNHHPFLIKPNREELAAYFGCGGGEIDIAGAAVKLLDRVENVLVSDGERGAFFVNKNGIRYLPVTDTGYKAKNTTGAGDSMTAGYLYGEKNGLDPFVCAVSAGSASAYSEGLFEKNIFDAVIKSYKTV